MFALSKQDRHKSALPAVQTCTPPPPRECLPPDCRAPRGHSEGSFRDKAEWLVFFQTTTKYFRLNRLTRCGGTHPKQNSGRQRKPHRSTMQRRRTPPPRSHLMDMNLVWSNSALIVASSSSCLLLTCGRSILFSTTTCSWSCSCLVSWSAPRAAAKQPAYTQITGKMFIKADDEGGPGR